MKFKIILYTGISFIVFISLLMILNLFTTSKSETKKKPQVMEYPKNDRKSRFPIKNASGTLQINGIKVSDTLVSKNQAVLVEVFVSANQKENLSYEWHTKPDNSVELKVFNEKIKLNPNLIKVVTDSESKELVEKKNSIRFISDSQGIYQVFCVVSDGKSNITANTEEIFIAD